MTRSCPGVMDTISANVSRSARSDTNPSPRSSITLNAWNNDPCFALTASPILLPNATRRRRYESTSSCNSVATRPD
eukprot:CAMPEP_0175952122 /NCGR_PEP_ID=MMETSP0108-20121206/30573_2 /TAXON_ID=195067 ORGANISM="Goniomonas pacifica, Strain CCMP1869" /NCGR_SAMPLE_ID=MMETSP0108 /ASSEMBLY_ACC=CAM_ASM_000204 /LENGTH=75 /DNA_ID=CAMNT_0017278443 /DNA_START=158 /DNA_END=385 /DNA_ORIENTATION=-